jgi:serine/threonine-protein kinase HipA
MAYEAVDLLQVWAWGHRVGALMINDASGFYAFSYDRDWIARGIELSPLRMALRTAPFEFPELPIETYQRLPAMVADSLPDRFGNDLVTAALTEQGVDPRRITPLDRLAYAADRAMGALEFRPPVPRADEPTAIQLADLVTAARAAFQGDFRTDELSRQALSQLLQVGTSAGGARAKAVICFNPLTGQVRSGQLAAPPGFEYWLLKLDGVDDNQALGLTHGYGRLEWAYALMAQAAGIAMMPSRVLEENGRAHFMVRRFDRLDDGTKVHLQSLCAIDHRDLKALNTNSYAQYLDVVQRLDLGPDALEEAFRRCVFNIAAVNRDDHTKNLAFTCTQAGQWGLAPAFDVTYSYNPVGEWTQRHQMSVNAKFDGITRGDLLIMAERFVVPGATEVIDDVLSAVGRFEEFADSAGVGGQRVERVRRDLDRFTI